MEHEVLRKLRAAMRADGSDALVALSQDNVTYTAGFLVPSHASNGNFARLQRGRQRSATARRQCYGATAAGFALLRRSAE